MPPTDNPRSANRTIYCPRITRTMVNFGRLRALCVLLTIFGIAARARGKILPSYDVDSLVYMSDHVVEGMIASLPGPAHGGRAVPTVKISLVHRGPLRKGQTTPVRGIHLFAGLKQGDQVVLFLREVKDSATPAAKGLHVVASGIKAVRDGMVLGFSQRRNPGPYVLESGEEYADKSVPTEKFRAELTGSIKKMAILKRKFAQEPKIKDTTWLTELLRERLRSPAPAEAWLSRDHVAELASVRLANLHEPRAIAEALPLAYRTRAWGILAKGLGTPEGREFVLKVIGDRRQPMATRVQYAQLLRRVGLAYHVRYVRIGIGHHTSEGGTRRDNGRFMTRIASLARENARHEKLACTLVAPLDRIGQSEDRPLATDGTATALVLTGLHQTTRSEALKYAIEVALRRDPQALGRLRPKPGPLLSLLRQADPTKYAPLRQPGLMMRLRYQSLLKNESTFTVQTVLEGRNVSAKYVIPSAKWSARSFSPGASGGGSCVVIFPKGMPAGRYRIYLRFESGDRIVAISHYLEMHLKGRHE